MEKIRSVLSLLLEDAVATYGSNWVITLLLDQSFTKEEIMALDLFSEEEIYNVINEYKN